MRGILINSLAVALFACSGTMSIAVAQTKSHDSFFRNREAYFHTGNWHTRLFERVKRDVEHVRDSNWPRGGDNFRLDNTVADLDLLQAKFQQHVYDDTVLQRVIDALSRVASFNRMPERDRKMLNDDISRLRQYRRHHADWFLEHTPQHP